MTKSGDEGIEKVKEGGYAFFMESTGIDYITKQNCNLMQVGGLLDSKGFGMATPMGKACYFIHHICYTSYRSYFQQVLLGN